MKRSTIFYSLLSVLMLFFSCDKDKKVGVSLSELKLETDVVVALTTSPVQKVKILSGNGVYKVSVENQQVATAEISNNAVEITPVAVGETQISVTDVPSNKKQNIRVIVAENIAVSEEDVTLGISESKEITITGSGDYELEGVTEIITASVENQTLTITGKKQGSVQIKVVDKLTQRKATISVSVSDTKVVLSTYEAAGKLFRDEQASDDEPEEDKYLEVKPVYVEIITQEGDTADDYQAVSNSRQIVEVSIVERNGKLFVRLNPFADPGKTFVTVTKKDDENGKAIINVTIAPKPFTLSKNTEKGWIGNAVIVDIRNGSGKFSVTSADDQTATAIIGERQRGGNIGQKVTEPILVVTGVKNGSTTITVTDTETQHTQSLTITIDTPYTLDSSGKLTEWNEDAILEKLVIPQNITEVAEGEEPFYYVSSNKRKLIKHLTIEGLIKIPDDFGQFEYLTTLVLGANITHIGAFGIEARRLEVVIIKNPTPPTLASNPFGTRPLTSKTLIVPTGAKTTYENAGWGNHFGKIEERDF